MTNSTTPNTKQELREKMFTILQKRDPSPDVNGYSNHHRLNELEQLLSDTVNKVLDEAVNTLPDTHFHGTSIRVKENLKDEGYVNGVRDSRLAIEQVRKRVNNE